MKKLALSTALALALVPTSGVVFTATSASAMTQDEATAIVTASLAEMGVTDASPELIASMVADLLAAEQIDPILDPTLLEPEPTPSPSDTTVPTPTPSDSSTSTPTPTPTQERTLFGRHYKEQSQLWALASPVWNAAFDTIRTAYDECVTANVAGVDCAATLVPDLQVAHATALAGAYDQIVAKIATLPVEEQAAAQAALDTQNTNAQKQLRHVLEEYTPIDSTTGLVNTSLEQLNALQAELEAKSSYYRVRVDDPAAAHRQDAEHRNDNSLRTAAPTSAPQSTLNSTATPSASASSTRAPRPSDDLANKMRQGNRR